MDIEKIEAFMDDGITGLSKLIILFATISEFLMGMFIVVCLSPVIFLGIICNRILPNEKKAKRKGD